MRRRDFLCSTVAARLAGAPAAMPRTFVYKTAEGCDIRLDAYTEPGAAPKPCAVWIHGGALIMGSRKLSPSARVLRALLDAGFGVVSIDYRLAPETKLPAIIDDVRDAFRWIRAHARELSIDPRRLVVSGGSAGGYLTLMSGFVIEPRPKALVPFWGYGDIVGPWYSQPDPFYLKQPRVSREEALQAVGTTPLSEPPDKSNRGRFYLYCRQQGIWPKEVAGRDPATDDRWFSRYCPIRNVTAAYPPTMLVHGTADTDVPYAQSATMAERLKQVGVPHRLVTVPDGNHGLNNIPPDQQDGIYKDAAAFLIERA
jgi:acetyl esterase/lipase